MAKKKPLAPGAGGLRDAVLADLPPPRHGTVPWHERLDAETLAELHKIREDWRAGKVNTSRWKLAGSVARHLSDRGLASPSTLVVDRWLGER